MVARVFGKADGFDVIFERQEGDTWMITVPSNLEGEYAVEIYAEDDAGNISFLCVMLFAICGHELRASVIGRGFTGKEWYRGMACEVNTRELIASVAVGKIVVEQENTPYEAELKKGGYAIERTVCSRDFH